MAISEPKAGERVKDVHFSEDNIFVDLIDGRTISAPLVWYPRLLHATPEQRNNWRVAGGSVQEVLNQYPSLEITAVAHFQESRRVSGRSRGSDQANTLICL